MKAALKNPGHPWNLIDTDGKYESISKAVDGFIELIPNFHTKAIMYCNEEGKLKNLRYNFPITDPYGKQIDVIVGSAIMFGPSDDDGNETELTEELFEETKRYFND